MAASSAAAAVRPVSPAACVMVPIVTVTARVPSAAWLTFRTISCVTASCSSIEAATLVAMVRRSRTDAVIAWMTSTARCVSFWIVAT